MLDDVEVDKVAEQLLITKTNEIPAKTTSIFPFMFTLLIKKTIT